MNAISRRGALKIGAGLLAFAPALKYVAFDRVISTNASPAPQEADGLIRYLAGRVVALDSRGVIGETTAGERVTLRYSAGSQVWKKSWSDPLPPDIGDEFVAWGDPNRDGSFSPEKIYFNIFTAYGVVEQLASNAAGGISFAIRGGRHDVAVAADGDVLVDAGEIETRLDPSAPPFTNGDLIQVVGLKTPDGVVATRILI